MLCPSCGQTTFKPCPFCGHARSHIQGYDGDYWRICLSCGAATRPCESARVANKVWNTRTGTKAARAAGGDDE